MAQVAQSFGGRNPNITVLTWELWSVSIAILVDVSAILMWAVGQR